MISRKAFDQQLTGTERRRISQLTTPIKIQGFLDGLPYSSDDIYRSPLRVLRDRSGRCFDGAVFAASMLCRIGYPALILDMLPNRRDDDHILALFRRESHWGALAKSNFTGLRFREPVYRTVRELIMSYFEQYYNVAGEKTLRGYTIPLDLNSFDRRNWMTDDATMELISLRLDRSRRVALLTRRMIAGLSPVDERSCRAGLFGASKAGLYRPQARKQAG